MPNLKKIVDLVRLVKDGPITLFAEGEFTKENCMDNQNTGKDLVMKIHKLKDSLQRLQEYKGEIFSNLQSIIRDVKLLRNRQLESRPEKEKVIRGLDKIEQKARRIEALFNSTAIENETESSSGRYYKINLRRILNFGILDIESEDSTLSIMFKGRLFEIMNELIKKYIDDSGTNVPVEFRGYVNRRKLEKKLYGKYVGRNRLNSHITRIRTVLQENGLTDTSFIKSLEDFVRLNVDSYDVKITDIATE